MDCFDSVRIPHGMALKITFYEFDVEFDQFCVYDYLEIINDEGTSFGKYCGEINNKEINVTGMMAQLQFHSDSDIQKGGFLLLFSLVPRSDKIKCGSVVNNTLTSPGYPDIYPDNLDCFYSVQIPQGLGLKISFYEFDMEFDLDCAYDYLKIINDDFTSFGKYCGEKNNTEIIVTGMYAHLQFHSDSGIQKRGFLLLFSLVPLLEIKCGSVVNNTLASPEYPDNYPPNMDCNYSVPIPHGMAIKITFYKFDVEFLGDCRYDYLEITNEQGKSFGKHCGEKNNTHINVTGEYAQLQFHSDGAIERGGFLLFFSVVPLPECGSVVNNTLTSPGYPNKYPSNLDCNYSVAIPPRMAIVITFYDFEVDYDPSKLSLCPYDYVTIRNDRKEKISKYCGRKSGTEVVMTGNYALLSFYSDYITQAKGFNIFFTFLYCGPECSFKWHQVAGHRLSCRNVTSLLDVIKCFPRIIPTL